MRDWKVRLERLKALAEDQAGTPEGELAARLAREITLDRHRQLSGMDLETRNQVDPFMRQDLNLGGKAFWRRRVASLTAHHCDCLCSFSGQQARLSGRRSSVLVADHLYQVMSRSITMEQIAWVGSNNLLDDPRAGRDFAHSAVLALQHRLVTLRQQDKENPESRALVRSDRKALRGWLEGQGVSLKADVPFPYAYTQDGYEAGYRVPLQGAVEESA
jgi:hypothetical protein